LPPKPTPFIHDNATRELENFLKLQLHTLVLFDHTIPISLPLKSPKHSNSTMAVIYKRDYWDEYYSDVRALGLVMLERSG